MVVVINLHCELLLFIKFIKKTKEHSLKSSINRAKKIEESFALSSTVFEKMNFCCLEWQRNDTGFDLMFIFIASKERLITWIHRVTETYDPTSRISELSCPGD